MRRLPFALAVAIMALWAVGSQADTELTMKASRLKAGMSREQVINTLGPATWVVLPEDKGEYRLKKGRTLMLFWKNPGCNPVVAAFGKYGWLEEWNEGNTVCTEEWERFNLPDGYLCSREARNLFCR